MNIFKTGRHSFFTLKIKINTPCGRQMRIGSIQNMNLNKDTTPWKGVGGGGNLKITDTKSCRWMPHTAQINKAGANQDESFFYLVYFIPIILEIWLVKNMINKLLLLILLYILSPSFLSQQIFLGKLQVLGW